MQNYRQCADSIDVVLANTVKGGDLVLVGTLVGVAATDGDAVNLQNVKLEGVFTLPKATGAITQGAKVYYDATNKVVTTTASGNTYAGFAYAAALSGDATVDVGLANGI